MRRSFMAIGCFVVHVGGLRYGVYESQASLLACSYDQVKLRIERRGTHVAHSLEDFSAGSIADTFRIVEYGAAQPQEYSILPMVHDSILSHGHIVWAPDGDAAFDDGSYILQIDVDSRVRLIAFRCQPDGLHDPATLRELWLESNVFYGILEAWANSFCSEWNELPKM